MLAQDLVLTCDEVIFLVEFILKNLHGGLNNRLDNAIVDRRYTARA